MGCIPWLPPRLVLGISVTLVALGTSCGADGPAWRHNGVRVEADTSAERPGLFLGPGLTTDHIDKSPAVSTRAIHEARAARLAVRSMSDAARQALADRLDDLATELEARLSPLSVVVSDGDPQAELRDELARYLPRLTAARWLAVARWTSSAGRSVRPAHRCTDSHAADERCLPSDAAEETPTERAARLAAWPLTQAAILRPSPGQALAVTGALHALVEQKTSTVALVVTASALNDSSAPFEAELGHHARRLAHVLARSDEAAVPLLAAWKERLPPGSLIPALTLRQGTLLVVPRLSALARLADFVDEVHRAIKRSVENPAEVNWIQIPPTDR